MSHSGPISTFCLSSSFSCRVVQSIRNTPSYFLFIFIWSINNLCIHHNSYSDDYISLSLAFILQKHSLTGNPGLDDDFIILHMGTPTNMLMLVTVRGPANLQVGLHTSLGCLIKFILHHLILYQVKKLTKERGQRQSRKQTQISHTYNKVMLLFSCIRKADSSCSCLKLTG